MHHERLDGSGYPHGCRQISIPGYIQLLSVIDVMEALTGPRPYRKVCNTCQELEKEIKSFLFSGQLNKEYALFILGLMKENSIQKNIKEDFRL